MTKIKVAVYDVDKGYRERFSDYLMSFKSEEIELSVFSTETYFLNALEVDKYQLFVLGCGYEGVLSEVRRLQVPILVLMEQMQDYVRESVDMAEDSVVYTSKYQSMDIITRQMHLMTEKRDVSKTYRVGNKDLNIIGVISPINHEMQMLFSLLYAKNLAKESKVLYVNLLEFSGFSELFGETENDLGDAVLAVRNQHLGLGHLQACFYEMEDFTYVSPFSNPENVKEITAEDILRLLKVISEYTDYESIILDIGNGIRNISEILAFCSKAYCLQKRGYLFEVQKKQFFSYLEKKAGEDLIARIETAEVPLQAKVISGGANLLEQLNWSEFGDFVRSRL